MNNRETCHWFSVCPIRRYTEQNLIDKKWVEKYCKSEYWRCVRRKMQEKGQYHPDNMMPDGTIDRRLLDE
ncbi:MAG: uracil-DNA glycosylase [Atribacterota bacterium]|jgi:hypothetical protein